MTNPGFYNPVTKHITEDDVDYEIDCTDCTHMHCCDDGDGRWDTWCHENKDQGLDEDFEIYLAKNCNDFSYDQGMTY